MNEFRVVLAVIVFSLSCYFIADMIIYSFSWSLLIASVAGFYSCHFIWPPKHNDDSHWYDWLELIVELPYYTVATFIRMLGRLFRSGFDIDI